MAVDINKVYQRVLTIANKEQRGYITPQQFNILANQAQMDLFEQYFYDINQANRVTGNSTEFSDPLHILEEKISSFRINETLLLASTGKFEDTFDLDITGWTAVSGANGAVTHVVPAIGNNFDGGIKILQSANGAGISAESATFVLVAGDKYVVKYNLIDMSEPASYSILVEDASSSSHQFVVDEPAVGSFEFTFIADTSGVHNIEIKNLDTTNGSKYITIGDLSVTQVDNTTLPANLYRLGEIFYKSPGAAYPATVVEVNSNEMTTYNLSPLTRPTTSNPAYVRSGASSIKIHPTTLETGSAVTCNYMKTPATASWGYNVVLGDALYNSNTTTNFDLHESEEVNLVNTILKLVGIMIEDQSVYQAAANEEVKDIQQEKQ